MFLPRISQPNCASGWLAASQAVYAQPKHEAHHVVIDITDPVEMSDSSQAVVSVVDDYLGHHSETGFLVRTVANTIFPQATYEDHGAPDFYSVYIEKIFPRLKRSAQDWGRYFERIIAYPGPDGAVNLLAEMVANIKRNVAGDKTYRNIYELPVYNPIKDANGSPRGGQCLSYMSFKLDKNRQLLLSAVYRNHYYTEKLLGNIIGLGRLMRFVGEQAKVSIGPLSILSTHAEVDAGRASQIELKALHARCVTILAAPDVAEG